MPVKNRVSLSRRNLVSINFCVILLSVTLIGLAAFVDYAVGVDLDFNDSFRVFLGFREFCGYCL